MAIVNNNVRVSCSAVTGEAPVLPVCHTPKKFPRLTGSGQNFW